MNKIQHAGIIAASMVLAGCANGSVTVNQPLLQHSKVATVRVMKSDSTVAVAPRNEQYFEQRLRDDLYKAGKGRFKDGNELTIAYRFIQYDEGNRAARYIAGVTGAGKGTMTVEVSFRAEDGTDVGKIDVGGELSGGVFGGDFDEAIGVAAKQAADFAVSNFAQ